MVKNERHGCSQGNIESRVKREALLTAGGRTQTAVSRVKAGSVVLKQHPSVLVFHSSHSAVRKQSIYCHVLCGCFNKPLLLSHLKGEKTLVFWGFFSSKKKNNFITTKVWKCWFKYRANTLTSSVVSCPAEHPHFLVCFFSSSQSSRVVWGLIAWPWEHVHIMDSSIRWFLQYEVCTTAPHCPIHALFSMSWI